jgi:hypothetical protein
VCVSICAFHVCIKLIVVEWDREIGSFYRGGVGVEAEYQSRGFDTKKKQIVKAEIEIIMGEKAMRDN